MSSAQAPEPQTPQPPPPARESDPPAGPQSEARLAGASRLRIFAVIGVVVLFAEIAALQYTMVASAARDISPSFPGVGANISWMVIIFGLVGGATTPLFGKMSDLWGKRRMMLVAGASFTVGTLVCALTGSWALFLVGRALEAVAITAPTVAYGLFRDILPRRYIPASIGVIATGLGMSALFAPLLGGWLLDHYSWRSLFWFMLIFVLVMLPLLVLVVPESPLRNDQRLDVAGALLLAVGVGLVLLYLSNGAGWGWGRPTAWAWLVGGLLLLVAFVLVERRSAQPIMDLALLFSPKVGLVLIAALFGSMVIGVQGYSIPYMLQTPSHAQLTHVVLGQVIAGSGGRVTSAMAPILHIGFNAPLAYGLGATLLGYGLHSAVFSGGTGMLSGGGGGEWSRKVGPRLPLIGAMATFTLSTVLYAFYSHSAWQYALFAVVFGIGFGAFYASAPNLIVEAVPAAQQGISAGMLGVVNSLATSVGTAVLTACLAANALKFKVTVPGVPASVTGGYYTVPNLYTDAGYREGLLVAAGAGVLGLAVAVAMRHGRTPATGGEASG
ncbi:MFS transporter [Streptacidiphilus sp. PB12-B1b]|uniref:MFS transporter n=1 Tax=Streptacidiphilus sp. PB12-B1b TaxID=2705012 RepID=UPI0015FDD2D8|nr:MFS transporter [Streptacidiphilus sp. PB12-B1b]QMU76135.1 MFS transporter [Streptacidiphilus sp. PB12-B1b]